MDKTSFNICQCWWERQVWNGDKKNRWNQLNFDCFYGYELVWSSECLNSCRSFSMFMRKFSSKQGPVGLPKFFFGFGMFDQKVKIAKTKQKVKLADHELLNNKKVFLEPFCKRFNIKNICYKQILYFGPWKYNVKIRTYYSCIFHGHFILL